MKQKLEIIFVFNSLSFQCQKKAQTTRQIKMYLGQN